MNKLYKFYIMYLYYSGVFWGYATFSFDIHLNIFVSCKKLRIWSQIMALILFYTFISLSEVTLKYLKNAEFYSFKRISFLFMDTYTLVTFIYILVVTRCISKTFIKLSNFSKKLFDSVGLTTKAQREICKSFTFIFIIDMMAYVTILYMIMRSINEKIDSDLLVVVLSLFASKGLKHLTSIYIFGMLFATQLIKKINSDLENLLNSNFCKGKMASKKCVMSLECMGIFYAEIIKFAKSVHEACSFIILLTLIFNLQEFVYGVKCFNNKLKKTEIFFSFLEVLFLINFLLKNVQIVFEPIVLVANIYYIYQTCIMFYACTVFVESVSKIYEDNQKF